MHLLETHFPIFVSSLNGVHPFAVMLKLMFCLIVFICQLVMYKMISYLVLHVAKTYCFSVGCSSAYNSSRYPEMDTVNTQVAEQRNSVLQRIKSALSYMNQENFMHHCKFFLWYRNKKIIEGLLQ